ncbi:hypothetical protein [Phenylobacterium sp.]|uniref:hypothetical protein n=1 Tax=Phenylobacterium sp. TaxID=1871053 RepID=UPI0030F48E77
MSISAIGASVLGALLPSAADAISKSASAVDAAAVKAAESKTKTKATLDAIRDKGIYQWAQEVKAEKLKEKLRAEILESRGTSEGDLAKLDPKQRASAESSIAEELARRIKEAMLQMLQDHAKADADGKPGGPAIIDIKV